MPSRSLTLRDEYTLGIAAQSNMSIKKVLTDHWENWYTSTDFQQMKSFNLDAVRQSCAQCRTFNHGHGF